MIDQEKALEAQGKLGASIGRQPRLTGIAVVADEKGSHYLRVNVRAATDEITAAIPKDVEGVPVVVEATGKLRPI